MKLYSRDTRRFMDTMDSCEIGILEAPFEFHLLFRFVTLQNIHKKGISDGYIQAVYACVGMFIIHNDYEILSS